MALKRATKSIPLAGGIQNDIGQALLDPPGMADIRNARFRKKDYAEKTLPTAVLPPGETTGTTDVVDKVKVCWADDNEIVTVGQNTISSLETGAAAWKQTPVQSDLSPMEILGASAPVSGGTHYTWAWLGIAIGDIFDRTGFAIAYQRRGHNSGGILAEGEVVVTTYDMTGKEIATENLGAGSMPQLQATGTFATLMYVSGQQYAVRTITFAGAISAVIATGSVDLYPANQYYTTANYTWNNFITHDHLRIGYTYNARVANHALKYRQRLNLNGVIGKKNVSGTIQVRGVNSLGLPTGTWRTISTDTPTTAMYKLLDVETDGADRAYVLYSETDTTSITAVNCTLRIARVTLSTGVISTWEQPAPSDGGIIGNGSLALHGTNDVTYAVSRVSSTLNGGNNGPAALFNSDTARVEWGVVDASWVTLTQVTSSKLYGHRLCSRLEIDRDESPCCLVQQFSSFDPVDRTDGGLAYAPGGPSIVPAAIKPVTTIFVKLEEALNALPPDGNGTQNMVVATLDAGQSRQLDASYAESCISLLDIWYDNGYRAATGEPLSEHEWYFGNRNILGLEDYFAYVDSFPALTTLSDARVSLGLGDSRLVIWHKSATIDCHVSSFPEGFAMNTAVPSWYDGAYLSEIAPLDQPEITSVAGFPTSANNVSHVTYNSLAKASQEEQIVQCVTGYYDSDGVVHRSAPSFPIFVGNASATGWAAGMSWRLDVTVTPPLSIFKGEREYFIEVYAGVVGSVPQLAATESFDTSAVTAPTTISFPFVLTPGASTIYPQDVVRSSKAVYTAGDVLASDSWPAWAITARSARRMFAVSVADPATVYYTKIFEPGVSPEFSAALTVSLGMQRKITAIGTVDDKVLVFEKDGVTILYGTGPDNTGANGDFITETMNTKLGCTDQDSIVTIPDGVMFYSSVSEEFHLISRDLQLHDLGSPFQDYTDFTEFQVLDSVNFQAEKEARWYLADQLADEGEPEYGETPSSALGVKTNPPRTRYTRRLPRNPVAVYNYEFGKWTVLGGRDNLERVAIHNNQAVGITDSWECYTTTEAEATDLATYSYMVWETPWIRVNQLQDFGRFYGATFLGRSLNSWTDRQGLGLEASDLQVRIRYDYEEIPFRDEVHLFRANQHFSNDLGERLQFTIKPARQKVQSVKFIIQEFPTIAIELSEPTYAVGRGYELTAVDLHYGAKGGSSRLSAGRKS